MSKAERRGGEVEVTKKKNRERAASDNLEHCIDACKAIHPRKHDAETTEREQRGTKRGKRKEGNAWEENNVDMPIQSSTTSSHERRHESKVSKAPECVCA